MTTSHDAPLDSLLYPFTAGQLAWPKGEVLFLRARFGAALSQLDRSTILCEQSFKPEAAALEQQGFRIGDESNNTRYQLVLILPPRQRDEARALFARAIELTAPGGRIVACAGNNEGARSHESDLEQLTPVTTLSKHKCRVFWTEPLNANNINAALVSQWRLLDAPRPILDGRFISRPGIFAWDRIDPASALLATHLPKDLAGVAADLGAGYGYLSAELLTRCPRITALDLYEAEQRALALAKQNLNGFTSQTISHHWHDVTQGLSNRYDVIVSNPPFHTRGGESRPNIGRRFIAVAAEALKPNGRLWLVANRHLAYEEMLDQSFFTVNIVTQKDGFKVIEARKGARPAR